MHKSNDLFEKLELIGHKWLQKDVDKHELIVRLKEIQL